MNADPDAAKRPDTDSEAKRAAVALLLGAVLGLLAVVFAKRHG